MVYACNHWELCGGLGNRINGMLTVFILAVLTNRSFFIELEYPVPVEAFFLPRRRADGTIPLTSICACSPRTSRERPLLLSFTQI